VLFTAALATLVYGLIESNQRSFSDGLVLGCLIAAGVLLAAFLLAEWRGKYPMFDLSLFRLPTFTGGSVAAFGLSASIFALLLYLVLYLQDILRFSALGTGVRLLILSGAILVASAVAGRLSTKVPVRLLIGPGLLLVGAGLLLMRGLDAGSSWTHLIPGLIVAGVGVGMINPPLASTAVGVVQPERAGMASGINSTFRQVGIATGIALLGTLFTNKVTSDVLAGTSHVPRLAGHGPGLAAALQSGSAKLGLLGTCRQRFGARSSSSPPRRSPPGWTGSCWSPRSSRSCPGDLAGRHPEQGFRCSGQSPQSGRVAPAGQHGRPEVRAAAEPRDPGLPAPGVRHAYPDERTGGPPPAAESRSAWQDVRRSLVAETWFVQLVFLFPGGRGEAVDVLAHVGGVSDITRFPTVVSGR
jgi:hypothetical protein